MTRHRFSVTFWSLVNFVMATYLLLRSNKESGPYSLQQLQQLGFKPYDLVWVEGRSVAWRYPGEVEELKNLAPVVEEQPFDRFYKKQDVTPEKHFYEIIEQIDRKQAQQPEKSPIKVFVSLPGQANRQQKEAKDNRLSSGADILKDEGAGLLRKNPDIILPENEKKQPETSVSLTEKYSQPLDDIKRQYAEIYLKRKKKTAARSQLYKLLPPLAVAVFVAVLAVFIYLNFTAPDEKENAKQAVAKLKPIPVPTPETTINKQDSKDGPENSAPLVTEAMEEKKNSVDENPETSTVSKQVKKAKAEIPEQEPSHKDIAPKAVLAKPAVTPKNPDVAETEGIKPVKKINISELVSVKANAYKRRSFGGIENLELTVINQSPYILDKVTVELQYLKPSEQPLRTETVIFTDISPLGSQAIKIPDSPRGIKVFFKIRSIESPGFEKATAGTK